MVHTRRLAVRPKHVNGQGNGRWPSSGVRHFRRLMWALQVVCGCTEQGGVARGEQQQQQQKQVRGHDQEQQQEQKQG